MDLDDDTTLWERARRGDGDAFAGLFDRHRVRVFRRALGLVASVHDAEDVTAMAFFELWRRRRSVVPVRGSVLPWLLLTTVNLARNQARAAGRWRRFLADAPRDAAAAGPDAEAIEARERLTASLARLAPLDAALFVLTAVEGIPIAEAAVAVGLKPATARTRLHRARLRLRAELADLRPAEGTL